MFSAFWSVQGPKGGVKIQFQVCPGVRVIFMLIAQPLWSSVTDAYTKKDFSWIKNTVKKMEKISIYFFIIIVFMFFMTDYVFLFWLKSLLETTETAFSARGVVLMRIIVLVYFFGKVRQN